MEERARRTWQNDLSELGATQEKKATVFKPRTFPSGQQLETSGVRCKKWALSLKITHPPEELNPYQNTAILNWVFWELRTASCLITGMVFLKWQCCYFLYLRLFMVSFSSTCIDISTLTITTTTRNPINQKEISLTNSWLYDLGSVKIALDFSM